MRERSRWREIINKDVHAKTVHENVKNIVYEYKQRAAQRKKAELTVSTGVIKRKVIEIIGQKKESIQMPRL